MSETRNRAFIVVLLLALLFLAAVGFGALRLVDSLAIEREIKPMRESLEARDTTAPGRVELNRMEEQLRNRLGMEVGRFFKSGEAEPATFGLALKRSLLSHGLVTESYKIIENETPPILDFSLTGRIGSLLGFLKEVSNNHKHCTISYLSLNSLTGDGMVRANIRIGYALWKEGETAAVEPLPLERIIIPDDNLAEGEVSTRPAVEKLFIWVYGNPEAGSGERGQAKAAERIETADWLSYVGTIVMDGKQYFIFKDTRTNRIHRLAEGIEAEEGWRYVRKSGDTHYLRIGDTLYSVNP